MRKKQIYTRNFYLTRNDATVYSANTILSILLQEIPIPESAIDVGCGVGTWLAVLKEKGAKYIMGLDGSWVPQDMLIIPKENFQTINLIMPINLPKRFDLAISLEVAEHLPKENAKDFVMSLTNLADFVLFSSAIPFQGGNKHINEQWPTYWVELFDAQNYITYDFIRARIWNDPQIPYWYRQNIFFFVKKGHEANVGLSKISLKSKSLPLCVVHPDLFHIHTLYSRSVAGSLKLFLKALMNLSKIGG